MLYKYGTYKGKERIAKMPNIPEHCLPVNDDLSSYNFKELKPTIDYAYYILRTVDLLNIPWQQLVGDELFENNNFKYL